MRNEKKDFTKDNIVKHLIVFGLPVLFANVLQSLYGVVDMLVVGRFVGDAGLAAISTASMISFVISSLCIGITTGGTVLAAQYRGAEDKKGQKETIGTLFTMSAILSILITVVGVAVYRPILYMLHVPEESMEYACNYMLIICMGTVFIFGYNAVCSILKGFGDSKGPLCFVFIATVVNVILDVLFVGMMDMGTEGAAYATVIAQACSFFIAVIRLKRQRFIFDFRLKSFGICSDKLKTILKVGVPSAMQMVTVNVSYLLVTGMLNVYGVDIAAASGIGLKVNTFAGMPCWAIGQAVTAMVSQNVGADDMERVSKIVMLGVLVNVSVTAVVVCLIQIFAENVISLFGAVSLKVLRYGTQYLRICCSFNSLIYAVMYTFDSFATAIGNASLAMFNSILDSVFVRLIVGWTLSVCLGYGFIGIYIGQALSPAIPALIGFAYYRSGRWRKRRLIVCDKHEGQ